MKFAGWLFALLLALSVAHGAETLPDGEYFYRNAENYFYGKNGFQRNLSQALKLYHIAARKNSSHAQIALARIYYNGTGVEKDFSKAFLFAQKAAETNPHGAVLLGWMYLQGKGCEKNPSAGFCAFMKAADAQIPAGYSYVAWCYFYGRGVEFNARKAIDYFKKAADCGDVVAMWTIGACLKYGQFMPEDSAGADVLFSRCERLFSSDAAAGSGEALFQRGMIYRFGLINGSFNIAKCRELWERAVEKGSANAKFCYAAMLLEGVGGVRDTGRAVQMLKEIADVDPLAKMQLVAMYDTGKYVARDQEYARKLFSEVVAKEADFLDNYTVLLMIGGAFSQGIGCEADVERGEKYFKRAFGLLRPRAEAGIFNDMMIMAYHCYFGIGCETDFKSAEKYLISCRKLVSSHAGCEDHSVLVLYGIMHQHGWGVKKSLESAAELFYRAYQHGSPAGAYLLHELCCAEAIDVKYEKDAQKYFEYAKKCKFAPALKK